MPFNPDFNMCCPKCRREDKLDICADIWVRLTPDGTDADEAEGHDHTWDEHHGCICRACGFGATVAEFTIHNAGTMTKRQPKPRSRTPVPTTAYDRVAAAIKAEAERLHALRLDPLAYIEKLLAAEIACPCLSDDPDDIRAEYQSLLHDLVSHIALLTEEKGDYQTALENIFNCSHKALDAVPGSNDDEHTALDDCAAWAEEALMAAVVKRLAKSH